MVVMFKSFPRCLILTVFGLGVLPGSILSSPVSHEVCFQAGLNGPYKGTFAACLEGAAYPVPLFSLFTLLLDYRRPYTAAGRVCGSGGAEAVEVVKEQCF